MQKVTVVISCVHVCMCVCVRVHAGMRVRVLWKNFITLVFKKKIVQVLRRHWLPRMPPTTLEPQNTNITESTQCEYDIAICNFNYK